MLKSDSKVSPIQKQDLSSHDEPDQTSFYRLSLESAGFKVETYGDSSEALSNFRPGSYDLILADIKTPVTDGSSIYQELKKKDSRTKIYFLQPTKFMISNKD